MKFWDIQRGRDMEGMEEREAGRVRVRKRERERERERASELRGGEYALCNY